MCLTFGNVARSLAQHGQHARLISKEEAKDVLQRAYDANLVQIGGKRKRRPVFHLQLLRLLLRGPAGCPAVAPVQPVETTNYIPAIGQDTCVGCGKCAKVCPVHAISLQEDPVTHKKKAKLSSELCLGCGVCARNCATKAIQMDRRAVQIITPVNSTHRFVMQAIEKGTLQNLLFDNQAFASHRAMAQIFGAILKMPPIHQALAASSSSRCTWTSCSPAI